MSQRVLPQVTEYSEHLPLVDLALTTVALGLLFAFPRLAPWPLVLAVIPWLLRLRKTGRLVILNPLASPLWLFMVSAVIGLWSAYNPDAAWAKFWMLAASLFLFYTLANQPATNLWLIAKLLGILNVFISAYFLLTNDWLVNPTFMALLDGIGERWMEIRPLLNAPTLHPNQVAGFIALLFPFGFAVGWRGWRDRSVGGWTVMVISAVLVLFGLLLTGSRGAWLALIAAFALCSWSYLSQRLAPILRQSQVVVFSFGLGLAVVIGLVIILTIPGSPLSFANNLPGAASADSRAIIYRNTLDLISDFPFTGGGLDSFSGLYSQYILIIPQRIFTYAHNLFLDVALEQGILGLAALVGMLLGSFWLLNKSANQPDKVNGQFLLRWAVTAGLVVMIGHGLVDDALYGNRATPLLWLLPGLVVALVRVDSEKKSKLGIGQWGIVGFVLILVIAGNFFLPQWRAALISNFGAVEMARVELADWPTNEWADGRTLPELQLAEKRFDRALLIYPSDQTAHYRLGMIAMLRRDYKTAVDHLEVANLIDDAHGGIQKSLAFSYLWNDQLDEAQTLFVDLPEAQAELDVYSWWWQTQGRNDLAQEADEMLARLNE